MPLDSILTTELKIINNTLECYKQFTIILNTNNWDNLVFNLIHGVDVFLIKLPSNSHNKALNIPF